MERSLSLARHVRGQTAQTVRYLALAILVGAVLAMLGPFGTYLVGGAAERFAYWIGSMLIGVAIYGAGFKLVGSFTVIRSRKWWIGLVGMTLLVSFPEALATRVAAFWLWPGLREADVPFSIWFAQTAIIGLIFTGIVCLVFRRSKVASHNDGVRPHLPEPVASRLGGDVLALQMEDHYVRVHRSTGSELILLSLGRAIEALDIDGLQIHRSWWVARNAVQAVEGDARSMRLQLSNGVVAPVARSAVSRLKAAGWIAK